MPRCFLLFNVPTYYLPVLAVCSSILQAGAPVVSAALVKTGVFALQVKAIKLLVDHHEEILPSAVVPALQACCNVQLA